MDKTDSILLGIIQGLTEFLPVSSSGHLVLLGKLLEVEKPPVVYELFLHLGTLLAIFLVYRIEIRSILLFLIRDGWTVDEPGQKLSDKWRNSDEGWIIPLIIVASIPTAVIGLMFEDTFEALFSEPVYVGVALLITGGLLMASRREIAKEDSITVIPLWTAIVIGIAQGMAITPGISRSGTTIAVALLLGVGRNSAGRFSFLISIPAILGACVLKMKDYKELASDFERYSLSSDQIFLGVIFSFAVGYFALRVLLTFVDRGKLSVFAWYCWAVGLLSIGYFGFVAEY